MTVTEMIKITFNLVVIYLVGGVILAVVYGITSPIKFQKEKAELEAALLTMIPEADKIEELGEWEPHKKHAKYYAGYKCAEVRIRTVTDEKSGEEREEKECIGPSEIGYIVEGYGKGYSSYIHVLASIDNSFLLKKIKIQGHGETPGLGDEIEKAYFLDQFEGKGLENLVLVKSETENEIQAITGATISSRAVTEDAVRNGVKMVIERLSGKVGG